MKFIGDIEKYFCRKNEVKEINSKARGKSISAERRDTWYVNELCDDVKKMCDDEKLKEINNFWKPYKFAFNNNPMTQIAFYNQSGVFDPSYIGFGLMRHIMVRWFNNETFATFRNKCFSYLVFPEVKHPYNVIRAFYGKYVDDSGKLISYDECLVRILRKLKECGELVIKPSLESGGGTGVEFLGSNMSMAEVKAKVDKMKYNFVCQHVIENHESFKVGGKALNTCRVVTMVWENQIRYVGAVFRMSTQKRVDNWNAGGVLTEILSGGRLGEYGITETGRRVLVLDNGFDFRGKELYRFDDVVCYCN